MTYPSCIHPPQPDRGGPKHFRWFLGLFMAVGLAWTVPATAAPPPNDTCAAAEVIPGSGPFPYVAALIPNVTTATTVGDPPLPSCVFDVVRHSVWYRFTPAATRLYTFSACTDSGTTVQDTVLAVYGTSNGACNGTLTEVACSDDEAALQAALSVALTSGSTYFIVVWSGGVAPEAPNTAVRLRVSAPVVPVNDQCAGAMVIPPGGPFPYRTPGVDVTLATTAGDPVPACATRGVSRGVWYRFTPPANGAYMFSTAPDTATTVLDTFVGVFSSASGCAGPFVPVACDDGGLGRGSATASLNGGVTYYILVGEGNSEPVTLGETTVELKVVQVARPFVTTLPATNVTSLSAILTGTANPGGSPTAVWFEYGLTTNYNLASPAMSVGAGLTSVATNRLILNLTGGATYHFRMVATNGVGIAYGADRVFTWLNQRPSISNRPNVGSQFIGTFQAVSGQQYMVEAGEDLVSWTDIGPAVETGGGQFRFVDPTAGQRRLRFYRLRVP